MKSQLIKVVALTTAVAVGSSLGTAGYIIKAHEVEVEALNKEIDVVNKIVVDRQEVIKDLQISLINKSESHMELKNNYGQLLLDHDNLKLNYENVKTEYDKNLKALNVAEEKIKAEKTSAIGESASNPYNGEYTKWKKMSVESTAYTSFENGDELAGRKWGNLTASGEPVRYGVIAVDKNVIPLGTEVYIPSLNKVFIALDTGSAIKGNIIDIYFNTLEECIKWGRKHNLEVYVNI